MAFKFRTGEEIDSEKLLGIKEEDLKNQLKAGTEANTKIDALTNAVNEQKTAFATIQETLARLAGNNTNKNNNSTDSNNSNNNNNNSIDLNDPNKVALAVGLNATVTAKNAMVMGVKSQMREAIDEGGNFKYPYWDSLQADIEAMTKNDPIDSKMNPLYWENVYKICAYNKQKDIADNKLRARRFFTEGVSGTNGVNGSGTSNGGQKTNEPSDIDKQQAAKFGIPIEKYMESKTKLVYWDGQR